MTIDNFIPVVWSARMLTNLLTALVYGSDAIVNHDYEGDIAQVGDSVKINGIGPVTISDYVKNSNLSDPETLTDAQTTLIIDKAKSFNFQVDDVDKRQQQPEVMSEAMRTAAWGVAKTVDLSVAALYTEAHSDNLIGSTASPKTDLGTSGNAYNYLVDLNTKLDEADIPDMDRWVVVPPWFYALLTKDSNFIHATATGDQVLRSGEVGTTVSGMKVFKSNNVPNTSATKYRIIAGWRGAITLAQQINQVKAYSPEKRFADAVKGLLLYGVKLIRPTGIAVLTANKP